MEKGTSLQEGGGSDPGGVGQRQPPSSGTPSPPPEQRGPQALVEAGKAAALEQVPGKLGGCGPRHSRSLCGGLGAPLRRELGLGGQDLLLGSWEERGQAGWLSLQDKVRAGPGGVRLLPQRGSGPPPEALTDAACVLQLDLQHLHGGGHDHLAGAGPAARQHLLQQRQLPARGGGEGPRGGVRGPCHPGSCPWEWV